MTDAKSQMENEGGAQKPGQQDKSHMGAKPAQQNFSQSDRFGPVQRGTRWRRLVEYAWSWIGA